MKNVTSNDINRLIEDINIKLQTRSSTKTHSISHNRIAKLEKIKEEITQSVLAQLEPIKSEIYSNVSSTLIGEFAKFSKEFEDKQLKSIQSQPIEMPSSIPQLSSIEIKEIKDTLTNHEENFEKIQDNFTKMNNTISRIENNQNLINEVIKALKENIDKMKIGIDNKISSSTNGLQTSMNESVIASISAVKTDLVGKIDEMRKQMQAYDIMLKNMHQSYIDSSNLESKIAKENKEQPITINSNDNNRMISNNNEEENEYANEMSINIHPNGLISNFLGDCVLEFEKEMKIKIAPSLSSRNDVNSAKKSIKNNITQGIKKGEESQLKREKNWIYLIHSPAELAGVDNEEFKNYLKKFVTPLKNYENVLEIDFDLGENDNNNDDDNQNNEVEGDENEPYYLNAENDEFDIDSL